jgi:hypothetical protein
MRHELVQLAGKIDWEFIDGEIAPLYSDSGRPGISTQFVIGLFLLKHIYGLSDEGPARASARALGPEQPSASCEMVGPLGLFIFPVILGLVMLPVILRLMPHRLGR